MAEVLGIRQSSISDAKRRNSIPDAWLVALLKKFSLNPDWILTGQGSKFLTPSASSLNFDKVREAFSDSVDPALRPLLLEIATAVTTAREKHKYLGRSVEQARRAVESEHKEWEAQAMLIENPDGTINQKRLEKSGQEGMDCIATHIRFLIGDFIGLS